MRTTPSAMRSASAAPGPRRQRRKPKGPAAGAEESGRRDQAPTSQRRKHTWRLSQGRGVASAAPRDGHKSVGATRNGTQRATHRRHRIYTCWWHGYVLVCEGSSGSRVRACQGSGERSNNGSAPHSRYWIACSAWGRTAAAAALSFDGLSQDSPTPQSISALRAVIGGYDLTEGVGGLSAEAVAGGGRWARCCRPRTKSASGDTDGGSDAPSFVY